MTNATCNIPAWLVSMNKSISVHERTGLCLFV